MAIGNPSSRCYANAPWRAFTWICGLLQETHTEPWGTLHAAVQESLELAEAVDIQQLPGLHRLWTKHDLNVQGDANHFVNTLWNLSQSRAFHYRYAEIKAGGYLADHVQVPLLVDFPHEWPENTTVQTLMNGWANEGLGQYLLDDKAILVTHITRNITVDGVATKHKKVLNPYGTFTVPRSMDGFARASTEFVPAALICHRGTNHEAGHYFAILIYRDLLWLADDGKVPTHLPHLTPQLASQVVQIWAVHIDTFSTTQQIIQRLPPPEEPDFDPPLHPSPEKKPRLEQTHNRIHYANITNFGRQVTDWYWTRTSEPYIFVETHLDPQQHEQTCQYYTARGRTAFGTPAWPNSDTTGTHGGILVLGDQSSCLTPVDSFTIQGCGYQAFLWQATDLTVLIAGIYLRTNESIQSEVNATIIAKLLSLLQATTHPFILIGDWQNKPSTISSTVLPSKFHFDILAPDVSMLSGNVIDYSLVHTSLSSTTALTTEWAVPWRPHALLTLHLDIDAATKEFRQIQYYPPLPPVPDIDFRPWTTFQSEAFELCLYDIPVNDKAQAWADWISATEQYLLQEHPWAARGRGANLHVSIKPLATPKSGGTWKKGKTAFWEQLQARFSLAQKQPPTMPGGPTKGFMKAIQDIQTKWLGPPTWSQFLDTCHHWHTYKDPHAADLIQHTIKHQQHEAQQAANDELHLQYKTWLTQGHAKGLKGLFRSLKSSEVPWKRPYRHIEPDKRMNQRLADWGALWHIREDNKPAPRTSLREQAQSQALALPPITMGYFSRTIQALPDKASGPDAVSAQLLRSAPPLALQPLLKLIQDMEQSAQMPTQMQMHMVVMLAKNQTIERPITLTSTMYRLWCRLRKPILDAWQAALPDFMNHDRARPGAQVLQVALERLLRQEVPRTNKRHGVTVLMDLSTFYDTIRLQQLQDQATAINYPPLMLEMAMQLYTGPKAIVAEQEMTPFFHVDQGVPAGCPQAPLLAKAVLTPALQPWHEQHPHIHLSSWVDDIGYDTAATTPHTVAKQAVEAYRDLHNRLTQLGMKVSAKKTAFIGTDKQVNKALKDLLTEDEPPVVPVMRDLGIDHQAGRARRIPVMKQRLQKAHQRKLKLRNLKIPALRVRLRLHRGGIQPVAVWGVESQGLAPRYRQALGHALAKQLGHHTGGILDVTYDIHKTRYMDPADQIIIHHIRAMHQLIQAWPADQLTQLQQAWTTTLDNLQAKQHPWYTVKGPMAATIAYLLEWGWNVQDLFHWSRPANDLMLAAEVNITDQWWQIEHRLTTEAHQQRTHRFANRPHHQHLLTGLDWHTYRTLKPKLTEQQSRHLQTWVQGALHYRDAQGPKPCPVCHVPATANKAYAMAVQVAQNSVTPAATSRMARPHHKSRRRSPVVKRLDTTRTTRASTSTTPVPWPRSVEGVAPHQPGPICRLCFHPRCYTKHLRHQKPALGLRPVSPHAVDGPAETPWGHHRSSQWPPK